LLIIAIFASRAPARVCLPEWSVNIEFGLVAKPQLSEAGEKEPPASERKPEMEKNRREKLYRWVFLFKKGF